MKYETATAIGRFIFKKKRKKKHITVHIGEKAQRKYT